MRLNSRKTSNQEKSGRFVKYQNWWARRSCFNTRARTLASASMRALLKFIVLVFVTGGDQLTLILFLHNCLDPGAMIFPPLDHLEIIPAKAIPVIGSEVSKNPGVIRSQRGPTNWIGSRRFQSR